MTPSAPSGDEHAAARTAVAAAVVAHRDAVEAVAVTRREIEALQQQLRDRQADVTERQAERDDTLRHARTAGLTYRQLEEVTGLRRAWLERVVHNRQRRG